MDRELLESLFHAAVARAQPALAVALNLPPEPLGRTIVIGAGKASAQMAKAFEEAWEGPVTALSSPVTVMGLPATESRSSKPLTRSQTPPAPLLPGG